MNRGIYLVFNSNGNISHKAFWNESSELFLFLKNCFLKIEWEYDFSLNSFSNGIIPSHIVEIIIKRIELELEDLIKIYNTKDTDGLNFVEELYKKVNYKLFYKSSYLHHQISSLIRIHRRLVNATLNSESIHVIGNAKMNKEMVNDLAKIKKSSQSDLINLDHIEINTLNQLVKEGCVQLESENYKLTLKGKIIDISEM